MAETREEVDNAALHDEEIGQNTSSTLAGAAKEGDANEYHDHGSVERNEEADDDAGEAEMIEPADAVKTLPEQNFADQQVLEEEKVNEMQPQEQQVEGERDDDGNSDNNGEDQTQTQEQEQEQAQEQEQVEDQEQDQEREQVEDQEREVEEAQEQEQEQEQEQVDDHELDQEQLEVEERRDDLGDPNRDLHLEGKEQDSHEDLHDAEKAEGEEDQQAQEVTNDALVQEQEQEHDRRDDSSLGAPPPPPPPPPPPLPASAHPLQMGQMEGPTPAVATTKIPRLKKRCLCDKDVCKVLTSIFSQLGDVRGGFVELPSKEAKNQRDLNFFSRMRWLATLGLSEAEVEKGKDKRLSKTHFHSNRFDGKRLVRWKPATDLTPQANLFTKDLKDYEVSVPDVSEAEMKSMLDQYMVERITFPATDPAANSGAGHLGGAEGNEDTEHIHHHHHHHHHHHGVENAGNFVQHHDQHRPQDADVQDAEHALSSRTDGMLSHSPPGVPDANLGDPPLPPSDSGDAVAGHHNQGALHGTQQQQGPHRRRASSSGPPDDQGTVDGLPPHSATHHHPPAHHESIVKSQYSLLASALNRRSKGATTVQLLDVGHGAIKELHSTRRAMHELERENKELKAEVQRLSAALQDRIDAGERTAKTLRREISVLETKNEALASKIEKDQDRLVRYKRRLDDLNSESAAARSKRRAY